MEHEPIKYPEEDVEDGEVSRLDFYNHRFDLIHGICSCQISDSDDGYTPLSRPNPVVSGSPVVTTVTSSVSKMEEASDKDESLPEASSSDDSDSDQGPRGKNRKSKLRYLK